MKPSAYIRIFSVVLCAAVFLSSCGKPEISLTKDNAEGTNSQETSEITKDVVARNALDQFLGAFRDRDFDKIEEVTNRIYSKKDFIQPDWSQSEPLFERTFGNMEWTIDNISEEDDGSLYAAVDITYIDPLAIVKSIYEDEEKLFEVMTPSALYYARKVSMDEGYLQAMNTCGEYMLEAFDANPKPFTQRNHLRVAFDEDTQVATVIGIPSPFALFAQYPYFDPQNILPDDVYDSGLRITLDRLLAQGVITEKEHYVVVGQFGLIEPAFDYTIEDIRALIKEESWFDRSEYEYVTGYPEDASEVAYLIALTSNVNNLSLYFSFYRKEDHEPVGSGMVMSGGGNAIVMVFDDLANYPSDTYRVVVTTRDGEVISDKTVSIGAP